AELDARKKVVEQISSSVKTELVSEMHAGPQGEGQTVSEVTRLAAGFERAQLIHADQAITAQGDDGEFRAFAWLDRPEAEAFLAADQARSLARLLALWR